MHGRQTRRSPIGPRAEVEQELLDRRDEPQQILYSVVPVLFARAQPAIAHLDRAGPVLGVHHHHPGRTHDYMVHVGAGRPWPSAVVEHLPTTVLQRS